MTSPATAPLGRRRAPVASIAMRPATTLTIALLVLAILGAGLYQLLVQL